MAPIDPQASSAVYSFPPSLTAIVFSLIDDGCSDENSSKTMRRSVTYPASSPMVSAIAAPRCPIGFSWPVVESCAV